MKEPDHETLLENLKLDYRVVPHDESVQKKISQEVDAAKLQQQNFKKESDVLDTKEKLQRREKPVQKFKVLVKEEFPEQNKDTKDDVIFLIDEGEFIHQEVAGIRRIATEFHTIPETDGVGEAHCQGYPNTMEDASLYTTIQVKTRSRVQTLVVSGMFDGHGSAAAAEFAKENIARNLQKRLEEGNPEKLGDTQIWNALKLAFVDTSNSFRVPEGVNGRTGTTANLVVQNPENGDIWVANAGDSRALLVSPDGDTTQTSEDAKPDNPKFKDPIERRGGKVVGTMPPRVNGIIGSARGIGDHSTYGANTARPKITKYSKPAEGWEGHTLVQACDGVFDVATSDVIGDVVHKMKERGSTHAEIAGQIVAFSYNAGSTDNISAMAIPLK